MIIFNFIAFNSKLEYKCVKFISHQNQIRNFAIDP